MIFEYVSAYDVNSNENASIQTVLDWQRNVAFVVGISTNTIDYLKENGINIIRVPSSSAYIIFRPIARQNALELLSIAKKYGGVLPASPQQTTSDVVRRIGQLLEYEPKEVEDFINKKFNNMNENFKKFIQTEVKKLHKITLLEEAKKKIEKELNLINEDYELDQKENLNELHLLPTKARLVVISHLSDVQEMASTGDTQEIRQRINFVKYLIQKYNDLNTDIMPDDEWEQFLERFSK
jgi:hypothetical protein